MPRYTTIEVERVVKETALAFCFQIDGREVWCPKSNMKDPTQHYVDEEDCEVEVAFWWAEKEELA